MTDLHTILPSFPLASYAHLLPALEQHAVTTADLLSYDARAVAARARLPVLDVARLAREVTARLRTEVLIEDGHDAREWDSPLEGNGSISVNGERGQTELQSGNGEVNAQMNNQSRDFAQISTLDTALDELLGGGLPAGYVTEVVGESGVGKTQFLLTLLLAAQLAPPRGRGRPAIYLSTEHALPTQRLNQLLETHPVLVQAQQSDSHSALSDQDDRSSYSPPSLARILTLHTPDLEIQEHILQYQLPVALTHHRPGLVVLDSIAANYRDADTGGPPALAARAASLHRTGALLRRLAVEHDCAIVVANHVADRIAPEPPSLGLSEMRSPPYASSSSPSSSPVSSALDSAPRRVLSPHTHAAGRSTVEAEVSLTLDHQQRFFTGWGADAATGDDIAVKTPALGLVWATQLAGRIAITKEASWGDRSIAAEATEVSTKQPPATSGSDEKAAPTNRTAANEETKVQAQTQEPAQVASERAEWTPRHWRRWVRLVFAAWAAGTPAAERGVEVEIWAGGVRALGP